MLLILRGRECCDTWPIETVLKLVNGEEGRPLHGRLAPTPCPDRQLLCNIISYSKIDSCHKIGFVW